MEGRLDSWSVMMMMDLPHLNRGLQTTIEGMKIKNLKKIRILASFFYKEHSFET